MTIGHLELLILDRLLEAQVCMRSIQVRGVRPGLPSTFWPETTQDGKEQWEVALSKVASKMDTKERRRRLMPRPTATAIDRMEETWKWVAEIQNEDARKAVSIKVFAWVHKISTSTLAKDMGIDRVTLNRRFNKGLQELMVSFCQKRVLPDPADEDLVHQFRPNQAIRNRNIAANAA